MLADGLPALCAGIFGAAVPADIEAVPLEELHTLYRQAMQADIERWRATNPPEMEAFHQLPVNEKIRLLRRDYRSWPAELRHS
jgi:hypothetical protein